MSIKEKELELSAKLATNAEEKNDLDNERLKLIAYKELYKDFGKAMKSLIDAFYEVSGYMINEFDGDEFNKDYPFDCSIDEMYAKMNKWYESTIGEPMKEEHYR